MHLNIRIALVITLCGSALLAAPAAPKTICSVDVVARDGSKESCRLAQEGTCLYLVSARGVEAFEGAGDLKNMDLSSSSVRFLRSGDKLTVLHSGGVLSFHKMPVSDLSRKDS